MKKFRPPRWSWLVLLPLLALLVGLGSWQVRRAHEKEALQAAYEQATKRDPENLSAKTVATDLPVAVRARGFFLPNKQLLLDNQSHDGQPGYHVWTPMRLLTGGTVIVDRGWIARSTSGELPEVAPPRSGMWAIRGLWRSLPKPGMRLAGAPIAKLTKFPAAVEYPTAEDLRTLLGEPVAAGVLELDAGEDGGFVREWNPVATFPPSRHYGYAVQWFSLAGALVVLFVLVNRKAV
ncbi:MAG TPA: SURF1 family protein [Nevskiaceae bacterium]|nr:SURF1 family protein [Nevskiaceae bacterium]